MTPKYILLFALLMVIGIAALQGQGKLVMRVIATGGLCPYGACRSEIMLFEDGAGTFSEGSKKRSFAIGSEEVSALVALIGNTDFEALRKNKFTGMCPTAYDGQEFIYSFPTARGEEILDSCKTAIDEQSPLFKAIQKLRAKHAQNP
jgi:hypothetical protein